MMMLFFFILQPLAGIQRTLNVDLVRFQKTPSSEASKREVSRRNVKLLEYSSMVNGDSCKRAGLLAAACHNSSAADIGALLKQNPASDKVIKTLKNDLPKASFDESKKKSIITLYEEGIMSKRKYVKLVERENSERRDISARGVPVSCLPRLLPYSKVMDLVKAVDRPPTIKCIDSIMPCYRYRLQDIVPRILQVYLEMG